MPEMSAGKSVIIGIDPSLTKTGFAVWDCATKTFVAMNRYDFWDTCHVILQTRSVASACAAVIENAAEHRFVYGRVLGDIAKQKSANAVRRSAALIQSRALDVGKNHGASLLLIEFLRRNAIPAHVVKPTKQKTDSKNFRLMTGYEGKTNQDERDAARLIAALNPYHRQCLERGIQP